MGPPLDQSPEPVRAQLVIFVDGIANGRMLEEIVQSVMAEYPELPMTRTELILGGEPAIAVEGLPGVTGSRQLWAIYSDTVYHLTAAPFGEAYGQAADDLEAVWDEVIGSFTFIAPSQ